MSGRQASVRVPGSHEHIAAQRLRELAALWSPNGTASRLA